MTASFRLLRDPVLAVGLLVAAGFVAGAILLPLWAMLGESLSEQGRPLFRRYLTEPVFQAIALNTVVMGLVVATVGTALGLLFAFVQVKLAGPTALKRLIHLAALVPIISPPFAVATAVIVLFGRNGLITRGLFGVRYDVYGLTGLTLVLSLSFFTVAYLNLRGMLEALDPSLEEASTNLGADRWRTFRTVTLPLLVPGLAGSFLLLFVEAIADLSNPLVIGGNYEVLATRIYVSVIGLYDTTAAAVLSVVLLVPALTVFLVQRYWVSRASVVSITGKPAGTPQLIDHPLVVWPLFALALLVVLLIALIYGTILAGSVTELFGINYAPTLRHFATVLTGFGARALTDTATLAALATPVTAVLGMLIAYLVMRTRLAGRAALDFATMLGIAVPGTVLGIGYLLTFNDPITLRLPFLAEPVTLVPKLNGGRAVLGGALAIVVVYVVRSVPAALRSGAAALAQIDPAIEEASTSLGAGSVRTFRRITLPLIRPAFLVSLIYAFARSMTTLSAVIFLTTPQTRIMTQQILNEVEQGRYGNAFALCVILIGVVSAAIGTLYVLVGSTGGAARTPPVAQ